MIDTNEPKCQSCGAIIEIRSERHPEIAHAIQKFIELNGEPPVICDECYAKNPFKYPDIGSMN